MKLIDPSNVDVPKVDVPYDQLIDAEIWAFIHKTHSFYPPDAANLSAVRQRDLYNEMCRSFNRGRPTTVTTQDFLTEPPGVPVREYLANDTAQNIAQNPIQDTKITVVYYHGGGFVVGNLDSHDEVCAEICATTGYRVLSCDYRLAPEHVHPAAFDDAWHVFNCASQRYDGAIVLAGDSAGATLAAAVSAYSRSAARKPVGQVLIYPYLGAPLNQGSAAVHATAPMLSTNDLEYYNAIRQNAAQRDALDVTFAPLRDTHFSDLPPSVIISAECDPLCDDGKLYTQAIKRDGGLAHWVMEVGLVHGYLRARASSVRARESFQRICNAIEALGQGNWIW